MGSSTGASSCPLPPAGDCGVRGTVAAGAGLSRDAGGCWGQRGCPSRSAPTGRAGPAYRRRSGRERPPEGPRMPDAARQRARPARETGAHLTGHGSRRAGGHSAGVLTGNLQRAGRSAPLACGGRRRPGHSEGTETRTPRDSRRHRPYDPARTGTPDDSGAEAARTRAPGVQPTDLPSSRPYRRHRITRLCSRRCRGRRRLGRSEGPNIAPPYPTDPAARARLQRAHSDRASRAAPCGWAAEPGAQEPGAGSLGRGPARTHAPADEPPCGSRRAALRPTVSTRPSRGGPDGTPPVPVGAPSVRPPAA